MNRKQVLILTFLLISIIGFSQIRETGKPSYRKIEKAISKEKSEFYYPKLFERYMNSDTTMTLKEKRHLYYGYSFQGDYSPYSHSDFSDQLKVVLQKKQHNDKELNKIIELSDSVLIDNPFDLNVMNHQLRALNKLKKTIEYDKKINQMRILVHAMLSSGDGLTKQTAYYVIYTSHEYDLLKILGYKFGGGQSLIEHFDYLSVGNNSQNIDGLYFDVSPCLNSMNNMFK